MTRFESALSFSMMVLGLLTIAIMVSAISDLSSVDFHVPAREIASIK